MKQFIFSAILVFVFSGAFAQQDTIPAPDTINSAKIYVIRATGYTGSAVNLRIFVDSVVYCKIKNNHYSVIYVAPGTHSFYANSWDASKSAGKQLALNMEVEAGKTYYLSMRMRQRFFENQIFVEEVTANTALPLLQKYKQDEKCD